MVPAVIAALRKFTQRGKYRTAHSNPTALIAINLINVRIY
jgi:hypothetical protein